MTASSSKVRKPVVWGGWFITKVLLAWSAQSRECGQDTDGLYIATVHSVTLDWLVVVTRPLQAALAWRLSMFCFVAAAHYKPCPRVQVAHNTKSEKACSQRSYFCARNHFLHFFGAREHRQQTAVLVPTFTNTNVLTTHMEIHSKSDTHDIVARLPSTSNLPMHRTRSKISHQLFLLCSCKFSF
jgi:hypothetical protein